MEESPPATPHQAPEANGFPQDEPAVPDLVSSREHSPVDSHYSYEDDAAGSGFEPGFGPTSEMPAESGSNGAFTKEDTPAKLQQAMDELTAWQAGELLVVWSQPQHH